MLAAGATPADPAFRPVPVRVVDREVHHDGLLEPWSERSTTPAGCGDSASQTVQIRLGPHGLGPVTRRRRDRGSEGTTRSAVALPDRPRRDPRRQRAQRRSDQLPDWPWWHPRPRTARADPGQTAGRPGRSAAAAATAGIRLRGHERRADRLPDWPWSAVPGRGRARADLGQTGLALGTASRCGTAGRGGDPVRALLVDNAVGVRAQRLVDLPGRLRADRVVPLGWSRR